MNAIRDFFLRAKHWQIFLLFLACFCLGTGTLLRAILGVPADPFGKLLPFFVALEVAAVFFATWLSSLGQMLRSVVPLPLRMRGRFFRFAVTFPPVYFPIFTMFYLGLNARLSPSLIFASVLIIFPLHFFTMFCQLYSWYFVSKCLALAERLRPVSVLDYLADILCIWFFPAGVWFIQPRVNRLYDRVVPASPS